jgi:hypothetical protein
MSTTPMFVRAERHVGLEAAERVAGQLDQFSKLEACIDFSGTRSIDPRALPVIAAAVARRNGRVTIVGLSRHERRILEYLGVDAGVRRPIDSDCDR